MESILDTTIREVLYGLFGIAALISLWAGISGKLGNDHRYFAWFVIGFFVLCFAVGPNVRAFDAFPALYIAVFFAAIYTVWTIYELYNR